MHWCSQLWQIKLCLAVSLLSSHLDISIALCTGKYQTIQQQFPSSWCSGVFCDRWICWFKMYRNKSPKQKHVLKPQMTHTDVFRCLEWQNIGYLFHGLASLWEGWFLGKTGLCQPESFLCSLFYLPTQDLSHPNWCATVLIFLKPKDPIGLDSFYWHTQILENNQLHFNSHHKSNCFKHFFSQWLNFPSFNSSFLLFSTALLQFSFVTSNVWDLYSEKTKTKYSSQVRITHKFRTSLAAVFLCFQLL